MAKKKLKIKGVQIGAQDFDTVEEAYDWANNDGAQLLQDFFQASDDTEFTIDFS